jgi:hypothetical protein
MSEVKEETQGGHPSAMLETALGSVETGLAEIPEPSQWDSAYGIDEAVAIAIVPERALVFWELAGMIASGHAEGTDFRLIRLHLTGKIPVREDTWPVEAVGRFQDGGLSPGEQYLYVLARMFEGEEVPLMVTNPIRMPIRHLPGPAGGPSSIDLSKTAIQHVLKKGPGK